MGKDPVTDPGKASKKGRLSLHKKKDIKGEIKPADLYKSSAESGVPGGTSFIHMSGDWVCYAEGKGPTDIKDYLVEVFNTGTLVKETTFDEIRFRADLLEGPFFQTNPEKANDLQA